MSSEETDSDRTCIVAETASSQCFASTRYEENPWIQIDLGKEFCITAVRIWNRHKAPELSRGT